MIMGQGGRLVVTGLVAGLVGAVLAARVMRSLLHGVSPTDPVALGLTVVVLLVVGALGGLLPRPAPSLLHFRLQLRQPVFRDDDGERSRRVVPAKPRHQKTAIPRNIPGGVELVLDSQKL